MKYSIQKSRHSSVKFTYKNGVKAYRSTPVELEFWARIQELEEALVSLKIGMNNELKINISSFVDPILFGSQTIKAAS
jgi:hypothetical protein